MASASQRHAQERTTERGLSFTFRAAAHSRSVRASLMRVRCESEQQLGTKSVNLVTIYVRRPTRSKCTFCVGPPPDEPPLSPQSSPNFAAQQINTPLFYAPNPPSPALATLVFAFGKAQTPFRSRHRRGDSLGGRGHRR